MIVSKITAIHEKLFENILPGDLIKDLITAKQKLHAVRTRMPEQNFIALALLHSSEVPFRISALTKNYC